MAGAYTTGQDANGNWYVFNKSTVPLRTGMLYYGGDTKQFNAAKNQLNSAGGQEQWEGYQQPVSQAPISGGGGGSSFAPLNQAAVSGTQAAIDQIPALLARALETEQNKYTNTENLFNQQQEQQQKTYDTSTNQNQQNYDSNYMASIHAGINGIRGLLSALRGMGASGGTFEDQARQMVGNQAAQDIRTGADTQKQNQSQLDSSLSAFLTDLKSKREANRDTFANNQMADRNNFDTQLQKLYGQMAGFYGDAGNTGQRDSWMNRATSLTPQIAQNAVAKTSVYDTTPIVTKAPELTAFAKPAQPNVLPVNANKQVGAGLFSMMRGDKRDNREPALVGV